MCLYTVLAHLYTIPPFLGTNPGNIRSCDCTKFESLADPKLKTCAWLGCLQDLCWGRDAKWSRHRPW